MEAVRLECVRLGKDPIPVFLDSGVRHGQHVVKALALGATGVMVGRMPIVGACLAKQAGVRHVLLSLMGDTQCTMINSGVETVSGARAMRLVRSAAHQPPFLPSMEAPSAIKWGTAHPRYQEVPTLKRAAWTRQEMGYIDNWYQKEGSKTPSSVDKLAESCFKVMSRDPAAHSIFHELHALNSLRLRTGIIKYLNTLKPST